MFWLRALVAALFALHPLHVESVAWISERKDVLSTFFGLLTLCAYVRYVEQSKVTGGPATHPGSRFTFRVSRFYLLSLCLFACSLMSKAMLVTFPFVLLLLDYWPLNRFQTTKVPLRSAPFSLHPSSFWRSSPSSSWPWPPRWPHTSSSSEAAPSSRSTPIR